MTHVDKEKLRIENSQNCSGKISNTNKIPVLHTKNYCIRNHKLDGDAPKQFIRVYEYEKGSSTRRVSKKSWPSYIAKSAEKWYPHESIMEYLINRIGQELGLHMNEIKLVRANSQIRFLSKHFHSKDEKLIHGAEICGEYLEDMDFAKEIAENKLSARELFTFEFIRDAIRNVFPQCFENLLIELVKLIVFDAIVGNNDRHFYNWGVIDTIKITAKTPTFAPVYDSARGLFWNYSDGNIIRIVDQESKIKKYIEGACPRISIEENKKANHFQLIDFLRYNSEYKCIIHDLSLLKNENHVIEMLNDEFSYFFIPERNKLIEDTLVKRFDRIRKLLYAT